MAKLSLRDWLPKARAIEALEKKRSAEWLDGRLGLLPQHWSAFVRREHKRRGGLAMASANRWALGVTEAGEGRLPLSASDDDLVAAAKKAAKEAAGIVAAGARDGQYVHRRGVSVPVIDDSRRLGAAGFGLGAVLGLLENLCERWEIQPAEVSDCGAVMPAIKRMCCKRWWLRRLRRAHGRRCDGAAIKAGMVRRGFWIYATQDGIERRQAQRRRNARALDQAQIVCAESGESLQLAEVVAGSIANPEVKSAELMVRIKGCDAMAQGLDYACEFWTLTAPSEYHAMAIINGFAVQNKNYAGHTPKDGQAYLSRVWARARAAWKRRGLDIFGLRTVEPHHDGCPHWHLIVYGSARDLRYARRLLRVYAMRQSPNEPGAKQHRFNYQKAKAGTRGAAYAAKYVSKNIDGKGLEGDIDQEGQKKISASVKRVDAWASTWGVRQFQFFGCPSITTWRVLRRLRTPVAVVGSHLEQARRCADDSDFAGFWRSAVAGGLSLIYRASECVTAYGDAAAARVAGVAEGARRALLPVKKWVIHWAGKVQEGAAVLPFAVDFLPFAVDFDLSRSCVNNCTRPDNPADAVLSMGLA